MTGDSAASGRMNILLSAYACEPHLGSEPGIGWRWAQALADAGHRVWVITRANNRAAIERDLARAPRENLRFAYYDLPAWARVWKRPGHGVRLYYALWQWGAYRTARALCREVAFDFVQHLTFGVFSHPSFMGRLGLPFVFGPVGGGESAPAPLRASFPLRGRIADLVRDAANWFVRIDPLMAGVFGRATLTLCKTPETLRCIPARYHGRCVVQEEVCTDAAPPRDTGARPEGPLKVLYVGRLIYWKGVHLALYAFAELLRRHPDARMTLIGRGPDAGWLHAIARRLGINAALEWVPWMEHEAVLRAYADYDVFLFPSLHDSSGNAVLEALACGLPVVCLDLGGPAMMVDASCGFRVPARGRMQVIHGLADALCRLAGDRALAQSMSSAAHVRARQRYSWPSQVARMEHIYARLRAGTVAKLCAALILLPVLGGVHDLRAAQIRVDPADPAASDAGPGDARRPYRTIARAMRALRPGDVLSIGAGTYRESIVFPKADWRRAPTIVQGRGAVTIKGSDPVTGWEPLGAGVFVRKRWPVPSEQVFVDGRALQQIGGTVLNGYPEKPGHPMSKLHAGDGGIWPGRVAGGRDSLAFDSFYYDAGAKALYVKLHFASLEGHEVEASVRPYLVQGEDLHGVTLRNLRFRHANTSAVSQSGAVTLSGEDLTLERLDVERVDGNGFDLTGNRILVRDSSANFCGQVGMKVRGRDNRLVGNETSFNNTRGFNKWWEAGGAKFVGNGGLQDSEITGHRAIGNRGDGLWFDWMNSGNRIHGNLVAFNTGFGIQYEASTKASILDNYVFGNGQRGIYLPNGSHSVVAHNLVAANRMEGIAVVNERDPSTHRELDARGNRVVGNLLAWNGKAQLVLPAGGADNASDLNVFLTEASPPALSLGWGSVREPVRSGLEAWRAASGNDAHSRSEQLALPRALAEALRTQDPDADWSALFAAVRGLGVREGGAEAGPTAGPATRPPATRTAEVAR